MIYDISLNEQVIQNLLVFHTSIVTFLKYFVESIRYSIFQDFLKDNAKYRNKENASIVV